MTDEAMYQLAALLPPVHRGVYADLNRATERYVRFPDGSGSNLAPLREREGLPQYRREASVGAG